MFHVPQLLLEGARFHKLQGQQGPAQGHTKTAVVVSVIMRFYILKVISINNVILYLYMYVLIGPSSNDHDYIL